MLGAVSCREAGPAKTTTVTDEVLTTFAPTTYFAKRIAGDKVPVTNPIPHDEDPIFFEPSDEMIARYQQAKLIIINGAEFEKWVAAAPLPRSRTIDSAKGFESRFISYEGTTHSHGSAGEHSHVGIDGHTWLDPQNATLQAKAIADGLAAAFPQHAGTFQSNLDGLTADLSELDLALSELTPGLTEIELYASHPAYNYVAARYGWKIKNLDLDPEDSSSAIAWAEGNLAEPAGLKRVMLWESEPAPEIAETFAERFGITSVVFSLGETQSPGEPDYLETQRANTQRLTNAIR